MRTENVSTLKIHKLTQSQYDRELEAGNIEDNAIYLTPNEEVEPSLPLTGGTITGRIVADTKRWAADYKSVYPDGLTYKDFIEITKPNGVRVFTIRAENTSELNKVTLGLSNSQNAAPNGITITRYEDGTYDVRTGNNKILFGQHNKPTGSYKGTGSARVISIGGVGSVLYVYSPNGCNGFITNSGAFSFMCFVDGSVSFTSADGYCYANGELSIADSNNDSFNVSGLTYYYEVL